MNPPAPPQRRVILCADDFAVNANASLGIAALVAAGRMSATSAMVLSPRWALDASRVHGLSERYERQGWAHALKKIAPCAGFEWASALFGIYDFKGDQAAYDRAMVQWLAQAPEGSIIMWRATKT